MISHGQNPPRRISAVKTTKRDTISYMLLAQKSKSIFISRLGQIQFEQELVITPKIGKQKISPLPLMKERGDNPLIFRKTLMPELADIKSDFGYCVNRSTRHFG